ncbi:MAG TPA: hypothetical protein DDW76_36490 [Cyanobacteria bacterium UBA11369]|nr:hypothetical protein [Cyanobacteria bacterium UBA11371]HBE30274.1 hypothetical protein [Cyanobacteria bacterium UBA11368]HBE54105.1 hypothetical protein [Cyanobacteria bacterium UBA11369]
MAAQIKTWQAWVLPRLAQRLSKQQRQICLLTIDSPIFGDRVPWFGLLVSWGGDRIRLVNQASILHTSISYYVNFNLFLA